MYEDNPFENERIAQEWITSIEGEHGMIRDKELYPFLTKWSLPLKGILLDIGAGQGICVEYVQNKDISYIGIDPSQTLINRAKEKYLSDDRVFSVGNAYELAIASNFVDVVLSVNVWFHLQNLDLAASELARVLKTGGNFLISTANPNSYPYWESMFDQDAQVTSEKIDGKVNIPVQSLSRNVVFKHSLQNITSSLENAGLTITDTINFGNKEKFTPNGLFINILGSK